MGSKLKINVVTDPQLTSIEETFLAAGKPIPVSRKLSRFRLQVSYGDKESVDSLQQRAFDTYRRVMHENANIEGFYDSDFCFVDPSCTISDSVQPDSDCFLVVRNPTQAIHQPEKRALEEDLTTPTPKKPTTATSTATTTPAEGNVDPIPSVVTPTPKRIRQESSTPQVRIEPKVPEITQTAELPPPVKPIQHLTKNQIRAQKARETRALKKAQEEQAKKAQSLAEQNAQNDSLREEQEKQEKERQEKERQEKERQEKERLEKERLEKERLEKERLEKERQEKERQEKERLEKERLEKERQEKEQKAKELREKEQREKEQKARELREKREKEQKEKESREKQEKESERIKLRELKAREKEEQERALRASETNVKPSQENSTIQLLEKSLESLPPASEAEINVQQQDPDLPKVRPRARRTTRSPLFSQSSQPSVAPPAVQPLQKSDEDTGSSSDDSSDNEAEPPSQRATRARRAQQLSAQHTKSASRLPSVVKPPTQRTKSRPEPTPEANIPSPATKPSPKPAKTAKTATKVPVEASQASQDGKVPGIGGFEKLSGLNTSVHDIPVREHASEIRDDTQSSGESDSDISSSSSGDSGSESDSDSSDKRKPRGGSLLKKLRNNVI